MPDYRAMARQYAEADGIDADIFERMIQQESRFDPRAYNRHSGAAGIAQIIPQYHPNVDPWNPVASLAYAANWIRDLLHKNNGSYARALASYNWGPGNVSRWDGRRESLPAETREYLDVILGDDWSGESGGGGSGGGSGGSGGGGGGWLPFDPAAIGEGLASGLTDTLTGAWSRLVAGGRDAVIDRVAPAGMALTALWCLSAGVFLATIRSDAGAAAIRGAATATGGAQGGAIASAATGAARALP